MFSTLDDIRDYLAGEQIQCLECGKMMARINYRHLLMHGMSADEYRAKHGIPWTYSLTSAPSRQRSGRSVSPERILKLTEETRRWHLAGRGNKKVIARRMPPAARREWQERIRPLGPKNNAQVYVTLPCKTCGTMTTTTKLNATHTVRCKECQIAKRIEYRRHASAS